MHLGDQLLRALGGLILDTNACVLSLHPSLLRTSDAASRSIGKKEAHDIRIQAWTPRICEVLGDGCFYYVSCDLWHATHADEATPDVGALQYSQNKVSN